MPTAESLSTIKERSKTSGKMALLAGTTSVRAAPDGLAYILRQGGGGSIGVSGGLTLISRTAADFRPPQLSIVFNSVRRGLQVDQYAQIEPTQSTDATHPSYYPGPGQHVRPGMTSQQGGQTLTYHWDVSTDISELIRRGEQEHLNDAQRAYDLTYGLIAREINALASQRFGPAPSRDLARLMAENALRARLPDALGLNPADWWNVLFQMLRMTKSRDDNNWHALNIDPPRRDGNRLLYPVSTTGTTHIDQVGSDAVVNYPSQPPSPTGTPGDFPMPSGQQRLA